MSTIHTCIVTPIAIAYKAKKKDAQAAAPCSRRDYEEQLARHQAGKIIMWDDAKGNPTKSVGGLLCFVKNGKTVEVHMVTNIHPPSQRAPSWSDNVGQGDRNVLCLTPLIATISWDIWSNQLGITSWRERGTRRVADKDKVISLFRYLHVPQYESETGEIIFK